MKAIILAAGKGERFGDITKIIPKPLIKLGELSLIEHNILLLKDYLYKFITIFYYSKKYNLILILI